MLRRSSRAHALVAEAVDLLQRTAEDAGNVTA
jgi:hypothetical protein